MNRLLLFLLIAFVASTSGSSTIQSPSYVSFCELVSNPAKFDQSKVLTSGIILAGEEYSIFYDPGCRPKPEEEDPTLAALENQNDKSRARKRLSTLLEKKKRVFVVVEARFDSYNRYKGSLPKDEHLQEILKKGNSRFGHQNCCRFRLAIQSVKLAEPTAEAVIKATTTP